MSFDSEIATTVSEDDRRSSLSCDSNGCPRDYEENEYLICTGGEDCNRKENCSDDGIATSPIAHDAMCLTALCAELNYTSSSGTDNSDPDMVNDCEFIDCP